MSTADLEGDVALDRAEGGRRSSTAARATDPAFTRRRGTRPQMQFHYATCARLLNYPDAEGDAGRRLVPEVAEDLPERLRRRPHVHVRDPEGLRLLAAVARAGDGRVVPARARARPLAEVRLRAAGCAEHRRRRRLPRRQDAHVAGRLARDARSSCGSTSRLRSCPGSPPSPAPFRSGHRSSPTASRTPVPSAGPYYLAEHADSFAVLKRNPNYGGSRPQRLDAIVFKLNVPPGRAASQIESGTLDYFLESQNPTLTPTPRRRAPKASGTGSFPRRTGRSVLRLQLRRPLFADVRMRRAVQYALDRHALADAGDGVGLPATHLSPRRYDARQLSPLRGDLRAARRLAGRPKARGDRVHVGRLVHGRLQPRAARAACVDRDTRQVLPMVQGESEERWLAKARRADLVWGGLNMETGDPPRTWHRCPCRRTERRSSGLRPRVARPRTRRLGARGADRAAVAVRRLQDRRDARLVSRRLGCIVHPGVRRRRSRGALRQG